MSGQRKSPEHKFQSWADRFLDRVVLPPMFTSGIDHASADMAHMGRRMTLQGRGIRFGFPDVVVCQSPQSLIVFLELKRGSRVSGAQAACHIAMQRAGQTVFVCHSMYEVLGALQLTGFRLHPNAYALANEYEMRVGASETSPETPRATRKHAPKASTADIRRAHAAGLWKHPA